VITNDFNVRKTSKKILTMYGLRLEDARFLGEGVDSLASFGRGAALHGETSEAGNNELTTLPANEQMIINLH
tara:strand:- start:290 stop:505 length:216 start_codon:yes stop_codon:yes gene_type:complete